VATSDTLPVAAAEFDLEPCENGEGGAVAVAAPVRPAPAAAFPWAGVGLVLIASVAWATSTIWLRSLTEDTNLIVMNTVRVPVCAVFLGSIAGSRGMLNLRRYRPRELGLVVFAGIIGSGVGSLLYVYSLKEAGAARSSLLNSLTPVFALPIAALFLKERVTMLMVAGTVLALGGVSLFVG
jgi:DME family drug/metabolite transporter